MPASLDKDSGEKEKNLLQVTPAENPFTSSNVSKGLYHYSHKTNLCHTAKQKGKKEERGREEMVLPYPLFATLSNISVSLSHAKKGTSGSLSHWKIGIFQKYLISDSYVCSAFL